MCRRNSANKIAVHTMGPPLTPPSPYRRHSNPYEVLVDEYDTFCELTNKEMLEQMPTWGSKGLIWPQTNHCRRENPYLRKRSFDRLVASFRPYLDEEPEMNAKRLREAFAKRISAVAGWIMVV